MAEAEPSNGIGMRMKRYKEKLRIVESSIAVAVRVRRTYVQHECVLGIVSEQ